MLDDISPADSPRQRPPSRRGVIMASVLAATGAVAATTTDWVPGAVAAADDPAQDTGLIEETMNAIVAMVFPGDDAYSRAQGVSTDRPGAVAAGGGRALRRTLDNSKATPWTGTASGEPSALELATGLALAVPVIVSDRPRGPFGAAFANLRLADKIRTLWALDTPGKFIVTDPDVRAAVALVAMDAYGECDLLDASVRPAGVRSTPPSWTLSGYTGPSDGEQEFVGYWKGRRNAVSTGQGGV